MPGRYTSTGVSLEPRRPANILMPLAWLLAGPLNPTAALSYEFWSRYFYMDGLTASTWFVFQAMPMGIAVAIALAFMREGGFGIATIALSLVVALITAASGWAITLAVTVFYLHLQGVYPTNLPVGSLGNFALTAGTGVRLNLMLNIASIPLAALLIRLIAYQRGK